MTTPESQYRLPSESGNYLVSPEMASDWVSTRNHEKNRPISKHVVARYLGDMTANPSRWFEDSPEGLIFDTEGKIISGAHRLKAQANANVTLSWRIDVDRPRELFQYVDSGYKRSPAHGLHIPNASTVATGARFLAVLPNRTRISLPGMSRVTTPQILATAKEYPELTWYAGQTQLIRAGTRIPQGPHTAVLALAARTEYKERIPEWIDGLLRWNFTGDDDPRKRLARRYTQDFNNGRVRHSREMDYSLITKAWNAWAQGKDMNMLRHSSVDVLPLVVGTEEEGS
jgi:hypothetical protein